MNLRVVRCFKCEREPSENWGVVRNAVVLRLPKSNSKRIDNAPSGNRPSYCVSGKVVGTTYIVMPFNPPQLRNEEWKLEENRTNVAREKKGVDIAETGATFIHRLITTM
jgi:hypothetical protein